MRHKSFYSEIAELVKELEQSTADSVLSRNGIILRRGTPCGWIAMVADLVEPLYRRMSLRVLGSHVIHTDDTGIKMRAEGQCRIASSGRRKTVERR